MGGLARLIASGGTVVNHDGTSKADVLIHGQTIKAVGPDLEAPKNAKVIDATGQLVMPGGIDPHTHLDMPFMGQVTCDDFFTGHAAALAGGTTMHIDFALPIDHDLKKGYEAWQARPR
ncbi:dihydropyrimidinase [Monoraphidium neglectum]|uniref:Dihydropyrimidinase n=1 Tax=Monoraphidium neglectum TaxID=145388 RepID=A0A0D2MCK1_9CHLO|nr:dihydropyrimidinase [Monoraphidium neglectum]KIY98556.1 dihydropyrimidinase [Monoraphidium neglectum]|eukprot:XP_013897576.1 dihydropyrimidinase [Monoraphidium neglectum]